MQVAVVAGAVALAFVFSCFTELIPQERVRDLQHIGLKEYQLDRLDPNTHHHNASTTAIAIGGIGGLGYRKSVYTARGWLPTPDTDSVFPAFGEEFGLFGLIGILLLYYALIYLSFQVTAVAKDTFGHLLSAGIASYLAMHVLVNIGMMLGLLPITGVPLILLSYGGS